MASSGDGFVPTDECFRLIKQCKTFQSSNLTAYKLCQQQLHKCFESHSINKSTSTNPPEPHELPAIFIVIFVLISTISVLSNFFVCIVYGFNKEIRTAKHYFIVNLAVADILVAALAVPFFLTQYLAHASRLCQIGSVFDMLCCTASIVTFAVISFERFVAVRYPLRYPSIVSRKYCSCAVAFIWIYAITFAVSSYIPIGTFYWQHCVFFTDSYIVATTFMCFLLPLFVMLVIYGWIFKIAKYQARQINNSIPRGLDSVGIVRHEFKAAKTLSLIVGVFTVCWFPFFAYICLVGPLRLPKPSLTVFYTVQVVRYLNSLLNPFLYVAINKEFRRCAFKLFKKLPFLARNNSVTESSCPSSSGLTQRSLVYQRTNFSCVNNGIARHDTVDEGV